ncbi:MAG: tetratricopeptide repeat protein [Telmatospirillum sp.]|nr:tetratricopeptide repeat protein [Telmatospirillum sp.]
MADVFDEVSEDLRRERALKLWKKFAPLLGSVAVAIVLATAGYVLWQDYSRKRTEADALRFAEAARLGTEDATRAVAELRAIARDGQAGYAALARFKAASLAASGSDPAEAVAQYRAIAADAAFDAQLRDAATLVATLLAVDTASPGDAVRAVQALQTSTGPWRHAAREIEALAHLRAGDRGRAAELYRQLADDLAAPAGLRQRASEMLAALDG